MKRIELLGRGLVLRRAFGAVAVACLCGPSISHGGTIIIQSNSTTLTQTFRITIPAVPGTSAQTTATLGPGGGNDGTLQAGGNYAGLNFNVTTTAKGNFAIQSTTGVEPTVERIANAPILPVLNPLFTVMGMVPSFPGEVGFVSLVEVGFISETSIGGATVSLGIDGGYTASYVTQRGDTFQTIENNLVSSLDANGVDAFISGTSLDVISSISDQNSLAGAIAFGDGDPTLQFDMVAGTVPEESSTLALLGLGTLCLLACDWRRRMAKA